MTHSLPLIRKINLKAKTEASEDDFSLVLCIRIFKKFSWKITNEIWVQFNKVNQNGFHKRLNGFQRVIARTTKWVLAMSESVLSKSKSVLMNLKGICISLLSTRLRWTLTNHIRIWMSLISLLMSLNESWPTINKSLLILTGFEWCFGVAIWVRWVWKASK